MEKENKFIAFLDVQSKSFAGLALCFVIAAFLDTALIIAFSVYIASVNDAMDYVYGYCGLYGICILIALVLYFVHRMVKRNFTENIFYCFVAFFCLTPWVLLDFFASSEFVDYVSKIMGFNLEADSNPFVDKTESGHFIKNVIVVSLTVIHVFLQISVPQFWYKWKNSHV